ncbi:MAG TPA: carboxypeptidase regulatory-like domain-containing protein [Thermoanaerobaculia bacterium]
MKSRILYAGLLLLLLPGLAGCGKPVIYGKVTDTAGQPVSGAFVSIDETRFVAITAEDGSYELDYPPGELTLVASKSGYDTMEMSLSLPTKRRYAAPVLQLQPLDREQGGTVARRGRESPEEDEVDLLAQVRDVSSQIKRQQKTVDEIRDMGTALFSWLNDAVEGGVPGQQAIDVRAQYSPISRSQLERLLVPKYIQRLPETDAWGHPYEVRVNLHDLGSRHVFVIRSPGRDGSFSSSVYTSGGFPPQSFDEDIVWADGYFVRWPDVTEM